MNKIIAIIKSSVAKSIIALILAVFVFTSSANETLSLIFQKFKMTGDNAPIATVITGVSDLSDYTLINSDGSFDFYFNFDKASLCVKNSVSDTAFYSNPSHDSKFSGYTDSKLSDEIILKYRFENNIITLGSRNNRVKHTATETDGKIQVSYNFPLSGGSILNVKIGYYFENGTLFATVDGVTVPKGCICDILSISVLKGLGSSTAGEDGFLLLPDGSGGELSLSPQYERTDISLSVYGDDTSIYPNSDTVSIIPAFGMRSGNRAMLGLALSGDAQLKVYASRGGKDELSYIYPAFDITASYQKQINGKLLYKNSNTQYDGEIKLAYRFLSDASASVSGMAAACREELYRCGELFYAKRLERDIPSLTLYFDGNDLAYNDVKNALSDLCDAGVSRINAVYANSLDGITPKASLGGKNKLFELYDFCEDMGINLHLEYDVIAHTYSGKVRDIFGHTVNAPNPDCFDDSIDRLYEKYSYLNSVYLNNLGVSLYSDQSIGNLNTRQEMKGNIQDYIRKLSVDRKIAVRVGNIYTTKNSNLVFALPYDCKITEQGYTFVPFVQTVLHAQLAYSFEPIRIKGDIGDFILKSMQYGTMPSFEVSSNYKSEISTISACYLNSYKILEKILTKPLISSIEVSKNLYCSTFDGGEKLYINYGDEDIDFDGNHILSNSMLLCE